MSLNHLLRPALLAALLCAGAGAGVAEEAKGIKPYPLDSCLVSNEKIDPQVPAVVYKGQAYRFCCKGCAKKFARDPDKYAALLAGPTRR